MAFSRERMVRVVFYINNPDAVPSIVIIRRGKAQLGPSGRDKCTSIEERNSFSFELLRGGSIFDLGPQQVER